MKRSALRGIQRTMNKELKRPHFFDERLRCRGCGKTLSQIYKDRREDSVPLACPGDKYREDRQ